MATRPDPPPAYTLYANEEPLSLETELKVRLSRHLIDILAFTYDVDLDALYDALSSTPLASKHAKEPGIASILSPHEREDLLWLSKIVADASKRTIREESAFIWSQNCDLMYHKIILPSISLGVQPELALDRLTLYPDHQSIPSKRNQTIVRFEAFKWRKPSTWLSHYSHHYLAKCLTSDDCLCQIIAPNDKSQFLIADAVAVARNKYIPLWSDARSISRTIYSSTLSLQLSDQIKSKRTQGTASDILPVVDQLWKSLCANRGFPARIPNGTPTNYEILRRQT